MVAVDDNNGGSVIVTVAVAVHPFKSVTDKVWVPAGRSFGFVIPDPVDHTNV